MEVNVEYSEKLLHNINVGMEASKLTTETINVNYTVFSLMTP